MRPIGHKTTPAAARKFVRPRGTMPAMANIASLLKTEISRVARKEVRAETLGLKKVVGAYRSEIAALKRRAQALELEVRRLRKGQAKAEPVEVPARQEKLRFTAKGLASQRRRLGLSAMECGLLGRRVGSIHLQLGRRQGPAPGQTPSGDCGTEDAGQERRCRAPGIVAVVDRREPLFDLQVFRPARRHSRPRAGRWPVPPPSRARPRRASGCTPRTAPAAGALRT